MYAVSQWPKPRLSWRKWLKKIGMEVTIIRPQLIYRPSVKGNFANFVGYAKVFPCT
jgi:hypothetical protein